MTMTIRTDRQLIRAGASSARFVLVDLVAPEAPQRGERLPVNVALIVDRSGSMAGARKFTLAREAVEQALRMLRAEDRFTLVVYDSEVDLLAPSAHATPNAKRRALEGAVGVYAAEAMSPIMLKASLFAAEAVGRGRDPHGKARRRP